MTDTKRLRGVIANSGLKYKYLADALGLSTYGLQNKIDGRTEFKASEMHKLSEILQLPMEDCIRIFFAPRVDEESTI